VDRQLFVWWKWLPNHCCNYHFFKQVGIQENEGASQRITEHVVMESWARSRDTRQIIGRRTIQDIQGQGKHYHVCQTRALVMNDRVYHDP